MNKLFVEAISEDEMVQEDKERIIDYFEDYLADNDIVKIDNDEINDFITTLYFELFDNFNGGESWGEIADYECFILKTIKDYLKGDVRYNED